MAETIILAILGATALLYFIQLLRFRKGLSRLKPGGSLDRPTVAVIIAARNEEDEIGACLESLSAQDYPADLLRVVVVDDGSTDRTGEIVRERSLHNPRLELIRVDVPPPGIAPKKHAVARGIEHSDSEIVFLTDADSRVEPSWISTMVRHFTPETGMVLGFTRYRRPGGSRPVFFGVQSLDFLSHAFVAAGAVGAGGALNSNANNMAFRRRVYLETGGYGSQSRFISGDDDLLLQTMVKRTSWKVDFAREPESLVTTRPAGGAVDALKQRMRWASTNLTYNPRVLLFLFSTFIFYTGLFVLIPLGIFGPFDPLLPLTLLGMKILFDYLVMERGLKVFALDDSLRYFLLTELIHIPYILTIAIGGQLFPHEWRGRKLGKRVD